MRSGPDAVVLGGSADLDEPRFGGEAHGDGRFRAAEQRVAHLVDGDAEIVGLVAVEAGAIGGVGGNEPDRPQVLDGRRDLQTQLARAHHGFEPSETVEIVEHDGHGALTPNAFALSGQLTHDLEKACEAGTVTDDSGFLLFVTSATLDGTSGAAQANEGRDMAAEPVEIKLSIPGSPDFLRLARLAAADAGSRAGLTFDEIEDLRIGVDELCHSVMRSDGGGVVELVFELHDDALVVGGTGPPIEPGGESKPSELSRTIVAAVVDEHELDRDDDALHFRLVKRSRRR